MTTLAIVLRRGVAPRPGRATHAAAATPATTRTSVGGTVKVTNLDELDIRLTALIERGVTTNHVRIDHDDVWKAKRRERARARKACTNCLRRTPRPGLETCDPCMAYSRNRTVARRG